MDGIDHADSSEQMILFAQTTGTTQSLNAHPWYQEPTRKLSDPILRMHNEAIDFYLFATPQPTSHSHQKAEKALQKVKDAVKDWPNSSVVAPFLENRLYLKDTEAEICILVPNLGKEHGVDLNDRLCSNFGGNCVEVESNQKYLLFELEVDTGNCNLIVRLLDKDTWSEYFSLIEESITSIPEAKYLYLILSCMVRQRWMHLNVRPYLLFGLISVFFYERKKQKQRTLSQNIIKFIEYFGAGPYQDRTIRYVKKGKFDLIQDSQGSNGFSFWVGGKNIANPSVRDFFAVLKNRYRVLSNFNFDEEQSVIGALVNPCQKEFEY